MAQPDQSESARIARREFVVGRCPHCETPYQGEFPDDCCTGREAEILCVEVERLREAGDALAGAVTDIAEPESVLRTWARRWREARLASDEGER